MVGKQWENLTSIFLKNNSITNIDSLNNFEFLQVIDASNCHLESINLNLRFLKYIDISQNHLESFPNLYFSEELEHLNVSNNFLADIFVNTEDIAYFGSL